MGDGTWKDRFFRRERESSDACATLKPAPRIADVRAGLKPETLNILWDGDDVTVVDISGVIQFSRDYDDLRRYPSMIKRVERGENGAGVVWSSGISMSAEMLWHLAQEQADVALPPEVLPNVDARLGLAIKSSAAVVEGRASAWSPPKNAAEAAGRRLRARIIHDENNPSLPNRLVMAIPLFWRLAIAIIVVSYAWNNWPFPPRARLDEIGRFVELSYVFLVGVLAYTLIFEPRGFLITTPIMAIYLCGILFYSVATPLVLAFAPIFAIVAVFWPERWKWKRRPKR